MKSIRWGDFVILVIALAIVVGSYFTYGEVGGKPMVHVKVGTQTWVYDLSVDRNFIVEGPIGSTEIEIHDGQVHVVDSDCKNKVCVSSGWKHAIGDWIICLPNNVFIMIEGVEKQDEQAVDAISF
ncbi:MAG: NusG domain II-containing protein [Sphaerochaetaceae bacterium]|jgi:hypothetical protein|nr:NusG domain II-containing protein [Sphaerochaetaceae bacterium]NLO61396.1 NusG domain II-containing protein [Spirochaetales bacterium]MDD2405146.1 NusG domain II-containing protein [Sphaerochaetaceae bacterium]MDD3670262.1 NusG domain II-containing protein [Sphaerochaetaceae bacterium]MDD4258902.1 NusG domain II-containing protein [Sphaerochaetaceae bacterium]